MSTGTVERPPRERTRARLDATAPHEWEREGRHWPNREASRFISVGGVDWHVQCTGSGPVLLLLHGTGASTHSWRTLLPLLAQRYTVVAPDLPGHAFSSVSPRDRLTLPRVASAVTSLIDRLSVAPDIVVGHSAGAAIAARMCLDGRIDPACVVSLNGALLPLDGLPGQLFSPIARLLASSALMPRLFATRARQRSAVERLVAGTGSRIDAQGIDLYWSVVRKPGHVAGALNMMSNWELTALERALPKLKQPVTLVVGSNDRTVSPREAVRLQGLLPDAGIVTLEGLGHLAHEEAPARVAEIVFQCAERHGLRRA